MKRLIPKFNGRALCILLLVLVCVPGLTASSVSLLGDYAGVFRSGQHIEVRKLVSRLSQLHVNTYMWLIWSSPTDWDDLKRFLPLAEKEGIDVWVYLVPHSETGITDPSYPFSEPFKLDYVKWAEEIAKLSLKYENLTGYVVDDFWENVKPERFMPDYTRQMVSAGKNINPNIRFYPLMYFGEINERFVEMFGSIIDGVVAAYPNSGYDIERALTFLNDDYTVPSSLVISFPRDINSYSGESAFVTQSVTIEDEKSALISFSYQDNFHWLTKGYHFMQFRVNGKVMWEEDVAGYDAEEKVSIDLSTVAKEGQSLELSFGVFEKQGVSNFEIHSRFFDINTTGIRMKTFSNDDRSIWRKDVNGSFNIRFQRQSFGTSRFHLPMIVMPAGSPSQFEKRYDQKGSPQNIVKKVRMAMDFLGERKVEGVVTYRLDKRKNSKEFELIAREYEMRLTESRRLKQTPVGEALNP